MKKAVTLFMSLILILIFCVSCSKNERPAEDVLHFVCAELGFPAGQTYLYYAEEGEVGYMSEELFSTLYFELTKEECKTLTDDYAIYLSSFSQPYEAAVFKCRSKSDTHSVIKMCMERADTLNVLLKDTEFAADPPKMTTFTVGNYVVSVLFEDAERAETAVKKAFR